MAQQYDKLVRDKIPEIIREADKEPTVHVVEGDEYAKRLAEKLDEEVTEYLETREVGELVDILEVVHAIRKDRGVSIEELEQKRAQKAETRGRFDEGIILERVDE